jgi:thiol-disulfide isomerase/thioredoxin
MIRRWLLAVALSVAILPAQTGNLVSSVRQAAWAKDVVTAGRLIEEYRSQHSEVTPQFLEALSWAARGASFAKDWDRADRYAGETLAGAKPMLQRRALDADASLPIAVGAAIEVTAAVLDARGNRAGALEYLATEKAAFKGTSIETRIQKNILLLSLEGKPAPALAMPQWIGEKPKSTAELKGDVVLLFFWAHWCGDCKRQMPDLVRLEQEYGGKGLKIVGPTQYYGYISRGENATPEQEMAYLRGDFQKAHPIPAWMTVPVSNENFLKFGVSTTPTLMLVDRQGIVRLYHPGTMPYEELASRIRALLPPRT